jgi:hypothetical protein
MYKLVLSGVLALGMLAACAGPDANVQPSADRGEVTTGSNIPRKAKTTSADRVERVDGQDAARMQGAMTQPGTSVR